MVPLITLLLVAVALAGCGSADEPDAPPGNDTDRAFAAEMRAHHDAAVEMAQIAAREGDRAQVRDLGGQIAAAQLEEIDELRRLGREAGLGDGPAPSLGLSPAEMGMDHDMGMLRAAKGEAFDRVFLGMMVPHHEGALRMARVQLAEGEHPQLKAMAGQMVADQREEIAQMGAWSRRWFGASPQQAMEEVAREADEAAAGAHDHGG